MRSSKRVKLTEQLHDIMAFTGASRTIKMDEVVDRGVTTFHHADLARVDVELQATAGITKISPYLYIGSWDNAVDLDLLRSTGIRYCLNVTELQKKKLTLDAMHQMGIVHDHMMIENIPDAPLATVLNGSYAFIKRAVDTKQPVLVHCHQGLSTSVAVISHYMMKMFYGQRKPEQNMLKSIFAKILKARGYIDVNFGFIEQLEDLEATISGRPVNPLESASTRRNAALKASINRQMITNLAEDRAFAEREYKVTAKKRY